jgi:excinuclease ABC subunit C
MSLPEAVLDKIPHLPESPGVYLWKDAEGTVLYVGKAKRLRSRVRSYVNLEGMESARTYALMKKVAAVDTIVVPSEAHALILEANLIKEYKPRFNISLRDDKSYPLIKVTIAEPFPRVYVTRRLVNDGSRYFGPYTDVSQMRRALNVVKRIFTVRSCNYDLPNIAPDRPCLDHHIGRCKAPCVLLQTQAEYRVMIDEVLLFLEGKTAEVRRRVKDRMELASESLDFERAAELRDAMQHLERMEEPTSVQVIEGGDRDVIGYARDGDDACVALMRIRSGRLLAREHQLLTNLTEETDGAVLAAYLAGAYLQLDDRARELYAPFDFEDRELIQESLEKTAVVVPQRGPKRELVDLAEQNARHLLEEALLEGEETQERAVDPVYELQRQLGLKNVPRNLVCFDISHAQGTDTVASCVWFQNGRPYRAEYRKFKVKTVDGVDDFASMREVVTRYFRRRLDEGKRLPDLVVIDGGKGQLSAALEALALLNLSDLAIIALAKREEEIFQPGKMESLRLPRRSPALKVLQQARDEAHRFAITYQRLRRAKRTVTSELLSIPGVGAARRRELLKAFGSLEGVKSATPEKIAELPGFSVKTAQKILDVLHGRAPAPASAERAPATEERTEALEPNGA